MRVGWVVKSEDFSHIVAVGMPWEKGVYIQVSCNVFIDYFPISPSFDDWMVPKVQF